jgi:nucleoside diphosphate kinase
MENKLADRITETAFNCKNVDMIAPARIGEGDWMNELLFFMKPEVFLLKNESDTKTVIQLMLDSLAKFDARIDGIYAINGSFLEKSNIMSKHYGFINIISNSASKSTDADAMRKIEETFGLSHGTYEILGGHEYLKKYRNETPNSLDVVWLKEKSVKLRSGFYIRHFKKDGTDTILVNGFHPRQLAHFTDSSHRIVLMLIHSNTSWSVLKNKMIGATFPEDAAPESIRGTLYKNAKKYGFDSITVANNCVHLSAGPFEGMAEIANFLGKITNMDIEKQQPILFKRMLSSGIPYTKAIKALENPAIEYNGKRTDLFTATEDTDSDKAISIFKDTVLKTR